MPVTEEARRAGSIDFTVRENEFVDLIGASCCGTTTLFPVVSRLPECGSATPHGVPSVQELSRLS